MHFDLTGWVVTETLNSTQVEELQRAVDEVQSWGSSVNCLNHFEMTKDGAKLCRTEYFTPFHVLYKEKINYKLSGGAGWNPHQDAPAYPFINRHVSCMIAVDDSTIENGCLEIVSGAHGELLAMDKNSCIQSSVVEAMKWQAIELCAGQTMWFHSLTPHRSADNKSDNDRRALYPTFNALREGDLREDYYRLKIEEFEKHSQTGDEVRLSLIDDFRGKKVK